MANTKLSNRPQILNDLDAATKSSLQPLPRHFRNYDAGQIHAILRDRANRALRRWDDAILSEIAAMTTRLDVLAERWGERVAIEIETGKSDIKKNIEKLRGAGFDRIIFVATSPLAVSACQHALGAIGETTAELRTWLDIA